jgi:predicted PurR-regulated permease PerM
VIESDQRSPLPASPDATIFDLAIRLGLLFLICYWAFVIIRPLLATLIWGVILAIALYPIFDRLAEMLGRRRKLAAVVITIVSILVVLGPVAWALLDLIESLQSLSQRLDSGALTFPSPIAQVKNWPLIGDQIYELWALAATNFKEAFAKVAPQLRPLGTGLLSAAGSAGTGIIMFLASVIIAGFLFVPGPSLIIAVKALTTRLLTGGGDDFVELAGSTIRNVSRGVIGIAILQAGLAGLGLTAAQIPGASIVTFLALVLGIVQIGPSILLIPVILWSWLTLETGTAIIFTAYMLPVCLVDNLLRPFIMGRGLITPMPVIFAGLIGGVLVHGIIGVFIGPVILAVAWRLLTSWIDAVEPATAASTAEVANG